MRIKIPAIATYFNITRGAEREPEKQRPPLGSLPPTQVERGTAPVDAGPSVLQLQRPLPPLAASQTRHRDALNRHVENYLLSNPEKMQALKQRVVDAFRAGDSCVSLDTRAIFPEHLCEAALAEITAIRTTDGEMHPGAKKRSIGLTAWARWTSEVKAEIARTENHAFGGNARQELRTNTERGAPQWHTDFGDVSSTVALVGRSTEFLPGIKADRSLRHMRDEDVPQTAIATVPTGHTLFFGGCLRSSALMHRTPPGSEDRLVFVG